MTRSNGAVAALMAVLSVGAGSLLAGCEDQRNDVKNAVQAAKGMAELAQGLKKAGEQAEAAGKEAEKQAAADLAAGKDPNAVQQQVELAKGLAAAQALTAGGGPAVNWRQLAGFLPDQIGDLKADGALKGKTEKMGPMEHSNVSRRYKQGESRVSISIADSSAMPMLRAPFAMAAIVQQDSSDGFKKGTRIDGHTALIEWREPSKKSEVTMLVADRFVVNVEVQKASDPNAAQTIVKQLPLAEIAKVTPEVNTEVTAEAK